MKKIFVLIAIVLTTIGSTLAKGNDKIDLIPFAKSVEINRGACKIDQSFKIFYSADSLKPIADMLSKDIFHATGVALEVSNESAAKQIALSINSSLKDEEYTLNVNKNVELVAKDFQTLSLATSSIVQLLDVNKKGISMPKLEIVDSPTYSWRCVLVDLARKWHPYESLAKIVDYLHFYKVKYMQLHLTDDQLFTFGTDAFPQLLKRDNKGNRLYYTKEELKELVEYARVRGVTIIPEIDLPGHSGNMWRLAPSVFGHVDSTGKMVGLSAVNMTKESCYAGLEILISEVMEVFSTSPYFHLGGDEVWMANIKKLPTYESFCLKHNLRPEKPTDLYIYFLKRMDDVIRKYGKKTILWEGFPNSDSKIKIPNDIPVIAWNTTYNSPVNLVKGGYELIHSTWFPFYMCGGMTFAPSPKMGYDWKYNEYRHWQPFIRDLDLPKENNVIGAQICFWEQNYEWLYDIMDDRMPACATRWWNYDDQTPYSEYLEVYDRVFKKINRVFSPISLVASGLKFEDDVVFEDNLEITANSNLEGEIKYFLRDTKWELSSNKWESYKGAIKLDDSKIVTVALFGKDGKMIGYPVQKRFYKTTPIIEYTCYGGAPNKGWKVMPQFDTLPVVRKGVFGKLDKARLSDIDRIYFVRYNNKGLIDTRPYRMTNAFGLDMKSKVNLPVSGEYKFIIELNKAVVSLTFGNGESILTKTGKDKHTFTLNLEAGEQDLLIKYFNQSIGNRLVVKCVLPGTTKEVALTDFMMNL